MPRPLLLFAPGAGAPSTSEWMERWAARLAAHGEVARFDYPYAKAGRRSPDPLPVLVAAHRAALAEARAPPGGGRGRSAASPRGRSSPPRGPQERSAASPRGLISPPRGPQERSAASPRGLISRHPGPVVLVGKSMGGRVGCHVALEERVAGVVCLGYPLRGQRGAVRDEVLLALRVPILFVQGSRDALCPLDLLERVRARMAGPSELHVVEGGDHSLRVGARALAARGETQDAVEERALAAIGAFVVRVAGS